MNVSTLDQFSSAFAQPIGIAQLVSRVPAAFSDGPAGHTSSNYVFISTKQLVSSLLDAGFIATQARQAGVRGPIGAAYARHMLHFQPQRQSVTLLDAIPQIVLINSHDGRSAYQLRAGLYRPICTNGLLTRLGDFGLIHVPHRGNVVQNVIDAALTITRDFSRVGEVIERMHHTELSFDERMDFAQRALAVRYPGEQHRPFEAAALLDVRRPIDEGNDLWRIFNVVQENVMRGGIAGRSATGRASRSRAIRAIREDVRINNDLWQLAVAMIRG